MSFELNHVSVHGYPSSKIDVLNKFNKAFTVVEIELDTTFYPENSTLFMQLLEHHELVKEFYPCEVEYEPEPNEIVFDQRRNHSRYKLYINTTSESDFKRLIKRLSNAVDSSITGQRSTKNPPYWKKGIRIRNRGLFGTVRTRFIQIVIFILGVLEKREPYDSVKTDEISKEVYAQEKGIPSDSIMPIRIEGSISLRKGNWRKLGSISHDNTLSFLFAEVMGSHEPTSLETPSKDGCVLVDHKTGNLFIRVNRDNNMLRCIRIKEKDLDKFLELDYQERLDIVDCEETEVIKIERSIPVLSASQYNHLVNNNYIREPSDNGSGWW